MTIEDGRVYVALVEDRHTDVEVHVFTTAERALSFAQAVVEDNLNGIDRTMLELDTMTERQLAEANWLYYAAYNTEGDCVRVLPVEVDG